GLLYPFLRNHAPSAAFLHTASISACIYNSLPQLGFLAKFRDPSDILSQHGSYWLKPGMIKQEKQITVCLLQTMIGRYQEFTSGYFDVVIADECHRSIYGVWQTALTHFDALHIGLTATPAAYIERNTFQFYQCRDGQPDFAFPIQQAFSEEYLVPYKFATGIT